MSQYLLKAGNTPALTFYEAQAMIGDAVEWLTKESLVFEAENDEVATEFFNQLGAAVKLAKVEKDWQTYSSEELENQLVNLLSVGQEKLKFGLAYWGDKETSRLSLPDIKQSLQDKGLKVRFIEADRNGLSAAVLLHQDLTEIVIIQLKDQIMLARTLAVQDIDHWTVKDRAKPYANRKKGMLPPKVARAMVNLALGPVVDKKSLVYDPFCGSGTVLMEALERGANVVGSDLDEAAAVGAQTNLAWLADKFNLSADFTVFKSDVAHVRPEQLPGKVTAIVTEPFLGKPTPRPDQLPGMFRGLEKLYLGAFHHWGSVLAKGARIVMVFPRVEVPGGKTYSFQGFVDKLLESGYTLQVDFGQLVYHRPQATVQRDIVVLNYQGNK